MQIAIGTGSLSERTTEALERAAALGFHLVEANLQPAEFGYDYRRKANVRFYREMRQQLDRLGLAVWSVTLPPLNQEQMFFERARRDMFINAAGAAGILGARVLVVRPADIFTSEMAFAAYWETRSAPPVIEGYDEGWAQAVNRRLTIALLNRDHWLGAPLTNQADRINRVTADLAIGWAMDLRRALARNSLATWLEAAGDRLAVAHLYDLDEAGRRLPPVVAEWSEFLPALGRTRLKCAVLSPDPGQSDDALSQSYAHIQAAIETGEPAGSVELSEAKESEE
jgi:sugar phosphate isomerase/epimerase